MILPGDYEFVQEFVRKHASIILNSGQEYLVRSRLEPVARDAGLPDLAALVQRLRREPYGPLHTTVIEAMTTNETSFFRDLHPFETLRRHVFPELMKRRRVERSLQLWSGACSTGQEPYSLAILVREMRELSGWNVRILATDLSKAALARARSGVYSSLELGRGLPSHMLLEHFDREGDTFKVKPTLRAMIDWRQLNLAEPFPKLPVCDVVLLRNVLIYFSPSTCLSILNRVRASMHSNGYLILGTTENMLGLPVEFESHSVGKTTIYRPEPRPRIER